MKYSQYIKISSQNSSISQSDVIVLYPQAKDAFKKNILGAVWICGNRSHSFSKTSGKKSFLTVKLSQPMRLFQTFHIEGEPKVSFGVPLVPLVTHAGEQKVFFDAGFAIGEEYLYFTVY